MRCAFLAAAVLLASCGSNEKSATMGGATFKSDESAGTASITTANGSIRTTEGKAAAVAMPAFAPLYPGATVEGVIEADAGGHKSRMVTLATTDPVAKVADFYKAALAKQGWNTPQSLLTGDSALLSGEKDGKQVSIAISRQDDKTNAVLSVPND